MGECIKDSTLVTDNTMLECEELVSTKCLVHPNALSSLLLSSGTSLEVILEKLNSKLTKLSRQTVKNLEFTNETSLTVVHNKGYFPIIQFKTLVDSDWSVTHTNMNQFVITFVSAQSDTLIYI